MSEEQEKPTTQTVSLPSGGSIPGIPGEHAPGRYLIDWIERTIKRVEDVLHPAPVEPPTEPVAAPEQSATSEPAQ